MPLGGSFDENDADLVQTRALLEYGQESIREITLVSDSDVTDDGMGGVIETGPPKDRPAIKRFFQEVVGEPQFIVDANGQRLRITHVMIGMPNDAISKGDRFALDGRDYEVIYVDPDRRSQTKAKVQEIGNGS